MKLFLTGIMLFLSTSCALVEGYLTGQDALKTDMNRGMAAFDMANYPAALSYFGAAADQGDIDAQYMTGMIYMYGLAGTKNTYMAQKWLTLAAQEGQKAAQELLAFLYHDETTPLYNPINAYQWFSIIIGNNPQYQNKLQNLEWMLRSRGLLATAQSSMPQPKEYMYKGLELNYNSLFPLR